MNLCFYFKIILRNLGLQLNLFNEIIQLKYVVNLYCSATLSLIFKIHISNEADMPICSFNSYPFRCL